MMAALAIVVGCGGGEDLLRDTIFEGEVEDERNDIVDGLEVAEATQLIVHIFDVSTEDELQLYADIVFVGKLEIGLQEIRGFEECDIPVDEATTDQGTLLRASFQTGGHSISVRGELHESNDVLEVQVTVSGLLIGTIILDRYYEVLDSAVPDNTRSQDESP